MRDSNGVGATAREGINDWINLLTSGQENCHSCVYEMMSTVPDDICVDSKSFPVTPGSSLPPTI